MSTQDSNFCFPLPPFLESDKVKLVPLVPSEHALPVFKQMQAYPRVFDLLPMEPFADLDAFTNGYLANIRADSGSVTFVIFDKTKAALPVAGIIGLTHTSVTDLQTEIGCAIVFPPFQRTHVTTHAVGLLLHYALDLPASSGLGLRRVSWRANWLNKASVRTAEQMGFVFETVLRWNRVFPPGKVAVSAGNGRQLRGGDPRAGCPGVDSVVLGLCWDDWENGVREKVVTAMARMY
ncbi:hypothetical protein JR316_0010242 [Psilocybe cubensis]|uniref:Uncharacterized protein n=2 Tax=Psilocybe cubensis TaxID=181762 RepID=A0ACB8GQJ8_PSICU|nr:hypothetical protein JR316_0010242 [Psilocybe cubensis]KAH9478008.1 hypothetical protein JR316_0010242 [Psilocybe cubensis]